MTHRFNERPSPKVKSRKLLTLQILSRLNQDSQKERILASVDLSEDEFVELMEQTYQELIDEDELVECGCCGHYHRPDFAGDCRNDDERFPNW